MKKMFSTLVVLLTVSAAPSAFAIEPLTATQLAEVCQEAKTNPDSAETRLCVFYVKGFLDGAVATDSRVAQNVASEIEEKEGFTERAIRTRVINRMDKYGPSVYADFCVGQPDPIAEVILHVIEELERNENLDSLEAQEVVYSSLRRHYPCED